MRNKDSILRKPAVQSLLTSLLCILLGLLVGFVVLLIINPAGAGEAIMDIIKNFLNYSKPATRLKNMGNTLVKSIIYAAVTFRAPPCNPVFILSDDISHTVRTSSVNDNQFLLLPRLREETVQGPPDLPDIIIHYGNYTNPIHSLIFTFHFVKTMNALLI